MGRRPPGPVQTQVVLQQAYREKIRMCLVLNKMDLLFTTLHRARPRFSLDCT